MCPPSNGNRGTKLNNPMKMLSTASSSSSCPQSTSASPVAIEVAPIRLIGRVASCSMLAWRAVAAGVGSSDTLPPEGPVVAARPKKSTRLAGFNTVTRPVTESRDSCQKVVTEAPAASTGFLPTSAYPDVVPIMPSGSVAATALPSFR